jgi:hypothetical protein
LEAHDVAAGAAQVLTEALRGTAGERALKTSELAVLAQKLIAATDEAPGEEATP